MLRLNADFLSTVCSLFGPRGFAVPVRQNGEIIVGFLVKAASSNIEY